MFSITNFFLQLRIASFKLKPIEINWQQGIMNTQRERKKSFNSGKIGLMAQLRNRLLSKFVRKI